MEKYFLIARVAVNSTQKLYVKLVKMENILAIMEKVVYNVLWPFHNAVVVHRLLMEQLYVLNAQIVSIQILLAKAVNHVIKSLPNA